VQAGRAVYTIPKRLYVLSKSAKGASSIQLKQPAEMAAFFDARVGHYDEQMQSTFQQEFTHYYQLIAEPIATTQAAI